MSPAVAAPSPYPVPDKPRVVLLEDDDLLREKILLPDLRDYGFDAVGASRASELYRTMMAQSFDLAVLDIGLPDESGLEVIRHLREPFPRLGVVMLTANTSHEDHVEALTQGADAYLNKPVDTEVLALTLRNLLRRLQSAEAAATLMAPVRRWHLQSDGWCLVSPDGKVAALTVSERSLLRRLDAERGHPVSRETLIGTLVEDVDAFDPHRLEMLVHRLRRKAAGIAGKGPALPLVSSRGFGYVLAD